jgi:hypothetical protein
MSFNWIIYKELNPDLEKAGLKTDQEFERHYLVHGRYENRNISIYNEYPDFKPEIYKALYGDLQHMNTQDLEIHWLLHGRYENRNISIYNEYPDFKPEIYKVLHGDLQHMNTQDLEIHWLLHGRYENRHYTKIINIVYILFWPGFYLEQCTMYKNIFCDNSKYSVKLIEDYNCITDELLNETHLIISGSFHAYHKIDIIEKYGYKTILSITEPLEYSNPPIYSLLKKNTYKAYTGCINNDNNKIKYPLYNFYMGSLSNMENNINKVNEYLNNLSFDEFCSKDFCCMINRHDNGNIRSSIFHKLSDIEKVIAPSQLLNNYPNADFENEGRDNFQRRFIFGLCPENFVIELDGYVTEKIYLTSIYGSIPIYYGKLDDIDKQVFNMNRVLTYDPRDEQSMNNVVDRVRELMSDKHKLFEFYKQKPYTDNALEVLRNMENNCVRRVKEMIDSMKIKKTFITFGAGGQNYYDAVNRLCNQARKTELFDEIKGITDNDLRGDGSFWGRHGSFIMNNPRGFGYWLWKPYIILKELEKMSYGDILVYFDCGNEINYHARDEFRRLIDSIGDKQLIATNSWQPIKSWTKKDLLVNLNMDNEETFKHRQHQAGVVMYIKNDTIMNFVKEWYSLCEDYHNIDDSPSNIQNYPEFKEHRHDQSVFSLLSIKYNLINTDFDPTYFENWNDYSLVRSRPVLTARNKTGNSIYKELQ